MKAIVTEVELKARLAALPRVRLAELPTPLDEAPMLSEALGGPRLLIKRDDLTGLAFGGNKIREFEYSLAPAVQQGYDILLNSAAAQSNQSRQTVAAANKLSMRSVIIARKDAHSSPIQGNLLLCHLLGAEIHMVERDKQREEKAAIMERLRAQGHRPWDTGYDGAVFRRVAYMDAFLELWEQLRERDVQPDALYICSGGHANVGLVVGAKALGLDLRIVGINYSVAKDDHEYACCLATTAEETANALGLDLRFGPEDIECYSEYVGSAKDIVTDFCREAIQLTARTEGLILDPVYTGKTMGALMSHIREGQFNKEQTVVFWHTGGTPALFAFSSELGLDLTDGE